MRTALLSIAGAGVLLLAGAAPSFAGDVNCKMVMQWLKHGKTAQEIADTMVISTSDVDKCKAEAAAAPAAAPAGGDMKAAETKPGANTN